jgi:ribokinase
MSGRVIVVGSANTDLVVTAPRLPGPGETVTGGRFARHQGGKGGNQAVAAARLGARTAFVGAVGDDAFGADARAALAAEGVDVTGLATMAGTTTGVALIVVDGEGENLIAVASGANAALTATHVRSSLSRLAVHPGDVVLVGHEIPTDVARSALETARRAGATAILNPAPAEGLDAATLAWADVLTPNAPEAAILAADCGDLGALASAVLVSRGAAGATLQTAAGREDIEALAVEAVDSVGAGDALNGALAAGLAEGRDLIAAARWAVAAAGLAVTRAGAREGMPTRAELEARLAR